MSSTIPHASSGFTLTEVLISSAILATISLVAVSTWNGEHQALRSMVGSSELELRAQETLARVQAELRFARGSAPTAFLTETAQAQDESFTVDGLAGFPDRGTLLVGRGTESEERVGYAERLDAPSGFGALQRGQECTPASFHPVGEELLWAGLALPIPVQKDPPEDQWDGLALELEGPTYFRGDGTGFCLQVPTDPDGGRAFVVQGKARWGATVNGVPTLSGRTALYFEASMALLESEIESDLNRDGDQTDLFELGKLRMRSWAPGALTQDVALGPTIVLQERCNHGGDLDGDGFDDPIFLWDPHARRVHVRLFCAAPVQGGRFLVRRAEMTLFLRNSQLDG